MRFVILIILLLFAFELIASSGNLGQDDPVKPYFTSYSNFRYDIDSKVFDFTEDKILFGIKYQLNRKFLLTVGFDLFETDHENSRFKRPYLKPCNLQYNFHGWIAEAGIFTTSQYDYQRNILWGFRYVFRTMQNHYSMGNNADLGLRVSKSFNKWLSGDISLTSGEGHKSPGLNGDNRYALRLFLKPWNRITFSAYGDFMHHVFTERTFAGTIDYRKKDLYSVSMEMNQKHNFRFSDGHQLNGISIYGNYKLNNLFRVFGRWDYLSGRAAEDRASALNILILGNRLIGGVQYSPCKFCRIALDFNKWSPLSPMVSDNSFVSLDLEIKY